MTVCVTSADLLVSAGCTDIGLHHRMVPTAGPPARSPSYWGHWSPPLHRVKKGLLDCRGQERVDGGGTAVQWWTVLPRPEWRPPPAAGASAVALHLLMAVSSEWMSQSDLLTPVHTGIPASRLDGPRWSPRSTLAPSKTRDSSWDFFFHPCLPKPQRCGLKLGLK